MTAKPEKPPLPEFTPIESSMFSGQHYDPNTRDLTIKFKNGTVYRYADVGADKHATLLGAASPGRWFNDHVKPNHKAVKLG